PALQATKDPAMDDTQLSRRSFLKGMGAGAIVASALPQIAAADAPPDATKPNGVVGPDPVAITLHVNGADQKVTVEPRVTLLDALRNHLDVTGPKKVCDRAT